jgi:rubrerythrin
MAEKTEVARLRGLAQLDADAVGAYDTALARIAEPLVRERLNDFRIDHMRHVQDLNALITDFGGAPVDLRPDLRGAAMKGITAMSSLMGTEAVLVAMMGNEEYSNRAYEQALRFDWSPEVRSLIQKHREDERRHALWIREAVRTRPWERARVSISEGSEASA